MEKIYLILLSVLFSIIIGMISFWIRIAYREFKQLFKELTHYINEQKQHIVGIETQINKGIEIDIQELKTDIKTLYKKLK